MINEQIKEELKRRLKQKGEKNIKVLTKSEDPKISLLLRQVSSMNRKVSFIQREVNLEKKKKTEEKDKEFKEVFVGIKRKGIPVQVHYSNGNVKIWNQKGYDITGKIPVIVKQFAKRIGQGIVLGELFNNGKETKITIYDKLFSGSLGDIHKEPYSFRRAQYSKMKEDKNIKISPEYFVKNERELEKVVKSFSRVGVKKTILKSAGKSFCFQETKRNQDILFKVADFQKSDKTVLSSKIKFPYRFKTVAFSEGTWHEIEYPWDVIKEGAPKIVGSSLVTFHVGDNDTILTEVGHIVDFETDDKTKQLIVDCELFDTSAGKDIAVLHANKRIPAVSVRLTGDNEMGVCKKIIAWPHVAIVREGEVSDAKPCYGGICQK